MPTSLLIKHSFVNIHILVSASFETCRVNVSFECHQSFEFIRFSFIFVYMVWLKIDAQHAFNDKQQCAVRYIGSQNYNNVMKLISKPQKAGKKE